MLWFEAAALEKLWVGLVCVCLSLIVAMLEPGPAYLWPIVTFSSLDCCGNSGLVLILSRQLPGLRTVGKQGTLLGRLWARSIFMYIP